MPQITAISPLPYLGILFQLADVFLFLSQQDVIKVEKIVATQSKKTSFVGIVSQGRLAMFAYA
jgi:hypothetical protein